jgi:glyoxylase-like metal-dependent hydrolase (beta-lactamase superfamily II)
LGVKIYYHRAERPYFTRETAPSGIRAWLGKNIPEEGVLVLLKGLLEEAAPEAVAADQLVNDGEIVEHDFRVIVSPGHTAGHVCYLHQPTRALFCGDALAVVDNHLRLMARPVTLDLLSARSSAIRCLAENPEIICPGHRAPLSKDVAAECAHLRTYLSSGGKWPLLG